MVSSTLTREIAEPRSPMVQAGLFMWVAFTTTKEDHRWDGILTPPPLRERKVMTGMSGFLDLPVVSIPMGKIWKLWDMGTATAMSRYSPPSGICFKMIMMTLLLAERALFPKGPFLGFVPRMGSSVGPPIA